MREWLGPDHPVVRKLLTKESPDELATRLIAETKLDDADATQQLWLGGKAAVDASLDPMIELVALIDGDARAIRKQYEDEVEAPIAAAAQKIAAARLRCRGPIRIRTRVHSAPELRPRARMGRERYAGRAIYPSWSRIRAGDRCFTL